MIEYSDYLVKFDLLSRKYFEYINTLNTSNLNTLNTAYVNTLNIYFKVNILNILLPVDCENTESM